MPSPRFAFAAILACAAAAGCTRRETTEIAAIADQPVVYDEAQALRDWPLTEAAYVEGDVTAGPAYFPLRIRKSQSLDRYTLGGAARVGDSLAFLGNLALLPAQMFITPPWATREFEGTLLPSTYHAAPPLPDEGETTREALRVDEPEDVTVLPATRPTTVPATTLPATLPNPLSPADQ